MITLKEILDKSTAFFQEKKVAHPRRDAAAVIADSLEMKPIELYMQYDRPLNEKEVDQCRQSVIRRAKGEPCQYIRGIVEFFDCAFIVDRRVLIPRMETEILVDRIAKELQKEDLEGKTLWDICTGSGCIGISLKKRFPSLDVVLSDLSSEALALAEENVEKNGVEARCLQGDLLEPFKGMTADFIVSNPPYVNEGEYEGLSIEVKHYEPKLALVSGKSGLEFYQRLSRELPPYLRPGAKVWMEIGSGQGEQVMEIFSGKEWEKGEYERDWGGHDRFFTAAYQGISQNPEF